jgi:hypothetical protein
MICERIFEAPCDNVSEDIICCFVEHISRNKNFIPFIFSVQRKVYIGLYSSLVYILEFPVCC